MKLGTTVQAGKLPDFRHTVIEHPVTMDKDLGPFILWQFFSVVIYAAAGVVFKDYLPIPLPLVPVWAILSLAWPVVPVVFALRFHRHYAAVCTAGMEPVERTEARAAYRRSVVIRLLLTPVVFPWAVLCCLIQADELRRAWVYWFAYNRQGIHAPGVLVSPVGSQPTRVWLFRGCIFLTSAASPELGVTVILLATLLVAPSLGSLKEHRHG